MTNELRVDSTGIGKDDMDDVKRAEKEKQR